MNTPTKIIPLRRAAHGSAIFISTRPDYTGFALEVARSRAPATVTSQFKEKQDEHPIH